MSEAGGAAPADAGGIKLPDPTGRARGKNPSCALRFSLAWEKMTLL